MADELFKLKSIELDTFLDKNNNPVTYFSQGDRLSDKLYIDLSNRDTEIDLTTATQVRIDFRKPDNKLVFQYCLIEDAAKGIVSVILNSQTVAVAGEVFAEVTVIYPNGKRVVTRKFSFLVMDAIAGDASIESSDFAPMIDQAVDLGNRMIEANVAPKQIVDAGALAANSLPKSGGTMTGDISMSHTSGDAIRIGFKKPADATNKFDIASDGSTYIGAYNRATGKRIWRYTGSDDTLAVDVNTNLLKKTGDIMTGNLKLDRTTGQYRWVQWTTDGTIDYSLGTVNNGNFMFQDAKGNQSVFEYDPTVKKLTIVADSNLVTKTKDNQVGMVITANGEAFDAGTTNVARRRGNTVTLRIALRRKAGSTDNIVATIPPEMRPSTFMVTNALSTDGTVVRVTVESTGDIKFSATDKSVYDTITYVVD